MTKAYVEDIELEQGSEYRRIVYWMYSDGAPHDFSAYSAELQMRPFPESNIVLLTLSSSDPTQIHLGGADGFLIIYIKASTTAALSFNRAVYDLEVYPTDNPDATVKLLRGNVTLIKEVTRTS